jgi:glucan phosphorylase
LRISQVLAGQNNGVVSGLHLLVSKEAIADGNTALFPTKITANPDQLQMHPDTLDVEDWIGAAVSMVLDKHVSGWRDNPNLFTDQALIRRLRTNVSFLKDLAEALSAQDEKFLELFPLLPLEFPDVVIGPKDCVLASARRLTTYKGQLLKAVLEEVEALEAIAGKIGRRIFVLIGGVAHQNDNGAQRLLWQLLEIQEKVNKKQGQVVMNFLRDWSYAKAPHIFSGLGRRGVWGAWSDPFGPGKEQNTEAFGPSALKAMMFFMYLIGAHDGGAKVLETCPTVELYGPPSVIGGRCVLAKTWGNPERQRQSRGFLVDGALAAAEKQFRRVDKDLDCYEAGEGHLSRGLPDKVVSFAEAAGRFNNSRIMKAYLGIVDEREKAAA